MIGPREEREVSEMVKVAIEVRSGTARFEVAVRANSIREALSLAGRIYPGGEVGALFPLEPEGFFAREPTARAGTVETERGHQEAA
jgi:hypothetical protein